MRVAPREEVDPVPEDSLKVNVPGLFYFLKNFPGGSFWLRSPEREKEETQMEQITGMKTYDTLPISRLTAPELERR